MKRGRVISMVLAGVLAAGNLYQAVPAEETKEVEITALETNGLVNPLGIDTQTPVFDWKMVSDRTGAAQTSYRITVAEKDGSEMWDSGEVKSSLSTEIPYQGKALEPGTAYTWKVTVRDEKGVLWESEENTFETSLMDLFPEAWGGAKWIGSPVYPLDAVSAAVFDLSMTMELSEESPKAGIVFGGGDFRLKNKAYNVWGSETDNSYFCIELDRTDVKAPLMNLYAVGMPVTLQEPSEDEKNQIAENDAFEPDYKFDLSEVLSSEELSLPLTVRVETAEYGTSNLHIQINGKEVLPKNFVTLNPLGGDISYNSFPNLNGIGFSVPAGSSVTFSDVKVENPGSRSDEMILFGKDSGATYAIFEGLDGVKVEGDSIVVGGNDAVLCFADPSWESMPIVRTDFTLDETKEISQARLYVSAEGLYEMEINGQAVSDAWFNPGNEEYRSRMPYQVIDVTELLKSGANAMGAQLTEGWWCGQTSYYAYNYNFYGSREALLARLDVTYSDGSKQTIVTDPDTWQVTSRGPLQYASLYHGERYDVSAEKSVAGWSTVDAELNKELWQPAVEIPQKYGYEMVVRDDAPAGVVRTLHAVESLGESLEGSGTYIYDMGENVLGVPHIEIPAEYTEPGALITVRYAEILYPELDEYINKGISGTMMVENLRAALAADFYTAGEEDLVIEPHFTYHGYRYVEIGGLAKELPAKNVSMKIISSIENTARYESSNELVNKLFANVQNSQTSNFLSIPTDCPQRNERLGWTGDAQVFSTAASYNADVYNFYRNWMKTFRADQGEDGALPTYSPCYGEPGNSTSGPLIGISWEGTIALVPYYLYRQTGRTEIIRENFDAMLAYMDFLESFPKEDAPHLTEKTGVLADWLSLEMTNNGMVNNAVYVYLMDIIRQMAEVIGEEEAAAEYAEKYELAKAEWNKLYVESETGVIGQDTQTSYATPLRFGVVSEENLEKAVENYIKTIERAGFTLTCGFSGTPNLLPVLTKYGYVEEAYQLFEQTDYASWLYPVTQGATSVWERWNSYTVEGGFNGNNSMNSFNHFSLGAVTEWMMAYQLGIAPSADGAGYKNFILQPTVGGTFTHVSGSFESDYGTIESGWTAEDGVMKSCQAVVPANTTATLYLPVSEETVHGMELPEGMTYEGMAEHNCRECAVFMLTAGRYMLEF